MSVRAEILRSPAGLRDTWNSFAQDAISTYEWNATQLPYTKHRQESIYLQIVQGDGVVGLFPLSIETGSLSSRLLRVLKIAGRTGRYFELVRPGLEQAAAEVAAQALLSELKWDQFYIDRVVKHTATLHYLLDILSQHGCRIDCEHRGNCFVIPLPTTEEEYRKALSKDTRYKLSKGKERLLQQGFKVRLIGHEEAIGPSLDDFLALRAARLIATGRRRRDAPSPSLPFLHDVVRIMHTQGWVRLLMLTRDDKAIAGDLALFYPPARTALGFQCGMLNGSWDKFGPGKVLRYASIAQAIAEDMTVYDEYLGEEQYKLAFKPIIRQQWGYRVFRPSVRGRIARRLISGYKAVQRLRAHL